MPRGPAPKDPAVRARRNKAVTAAELPAPEDTKPVKAPPLTKELLGFRVAIRPQVQRWWRECWASPMASRWLKTDVEVLYLAASLRQQIALYLLEGKSIATLAAELRQQEGRVGLDVMSRRRLDWRIEGPRRSDVAPAVVAEPEAPPVEQVDPRRVLRAL
jgi:hypothetical protein